jgi:hypothetical protein
MDEVQTVYKGTEKIPVGPRGFSSPKRPDRLWGPPSLLFSGFRRPFAGVRRPGRDVNHSCASSAEVQNEWSYTSTSCCVSYCDPDKLGNHIPGQESRHRCLHRRRHHHHQQQQHCSPLWASASPGAFFHDWLSLATINHVWTPIFLKSSTTWCIHRILGLPTLRVWNPLILWVFRYCPFCVVPYTPQPCCCNPHNIRWAVKPVQFLIAPYSPFSCTGQYT